MHFPIAQIITMLLCLLLLLPTVLALILCVDRHLVTVSPTAMSLLAAASSFAAFFSFYSHPRQSVSRGNAGFTSPSSTGRGAEMSAYRSSLFRSLKKEVSEKLPQG